MEIRRAWPLLAAVLLTACEPTATPASAPDVLPVEVVATSAPEPRYTPPVGRPAPGATGTVDRHVDGDTLVVAGRKVRLIGIDTPETKDPRRGVQCFGREAAARTAALLPVGTPVRLVSDVEKTDRYGRALAYVYRVRDNLFVNAALVRDGYAAAYRYPPNVAHADRFSALEREARRAGRGLWGSACSAEAAPAQPRQPLVPVAPRRGRCDPSYPDVCIPPAPPDLDCPQVSERRFRVVGNDPHGFDGDNDGIGCESG